MIEFLGLDISAKMFFYIMVSFSFFVGVFLMASPEAFKAIDKAFILQHPADFPLDAGGGDVHALVPRMNSVAHARKQIGYGIIH